MASCQVHWQCFLYGFTLSMMDKIALLSVSDKSGIEEFARGLVESGYTIISTGGTEKALKEAKIQVISVEDVTKFPECFSGRVKTMHPMLMGGILYRRGHELHEKEKVTLGINAIDVVCVNLYPFEKTAADPAVDEKSLIEQIDIGGPTLLRSAAKNFADVTVLCDPSDYDEILSTIQSKGNTTLEQRKQLALKVFARTAAYDAYISKTLSDHQSESVLLANGTPLRYGENPHQWGKYYDAYGASRGWKIHQGKELSYLNILDADGAWNTIQEFSEPTAACIKHANPCGVASHSDITEAFQRSYDADRLSAFGVIVSLNRPCTKSIIEKIIEQKIFVEVLIAPAYEPEALGLLESKSNIRVLEYAQAHDQNIQYRSALGGMLVQQADTQILEEKNLTCATEKKPTTDQINDLLFAWKVVKHSKSNAIVFAKNLTTVGIGCGQTSRVDSTIIAARKAGDYAKGSVMASDAFFPFPDSIEEAHKHGIAAIIQPGGSVRDAEVIAKANELGIPMMLTGVRSFRH